MIHRLDSIPSTNTWAKEHASVLAHGDIVITGCQKAGRGQRGNTWEATPGMNLTFSLFWRPEYIVPRNQWVISQAVALGITATLDEYMQGADCTDKVSIKWPNDIYVGDCKIAGILIEHAIDAGTSIGHTIVGIGLNVNQLQFYSDAPNPISLSQITGKTYDLDQMLSRVADSISRYFNLVDSQSPSSLGREYHSRLWRREGQHLFALPSGETFRAGIERVDSDGRLHLKDSKGTDRAFYFKEVSFVL